MRQGQARKIGRLTAAAISPGRAALELVAVSAATALALVLFPASHAANLRVLSRVLTPLRLALLVLFASVLLWRSGGGWRALGLRRPSRLWLLPLMVIAGLVLGELSAAAVVQFVYPLLHVPPPRAPTFLSNLRGDWAEYLYWIVPVTWGSAAFGEEMLFRGFILDRLDQLLGRRAAWAAVLLQALLFGAAHAYLGASGAIVAGVLGLVLGLVFFAGGRNLWPCILIHGLVDTISITAVFLGLAHR